MDTAGGSSSPVFADKCFTECGRWSIRLKGEKTNEEERGGKRLHQSTHSSVNTDINNQSPSHPNWRTAAEFSPLLGLLDLNRVFEDIVPGESAAQPVKKTKAQNL